MGANFIPSLNGYTGQGAFRFWCQKVLPLVYDDSLSYYELLNNVVNYLNNVITDVSTMGGNIDALLDSYEQLQDYVNDYFDNLDVQNEINEKLDSMATSGQLSTIIAPTIAQNVSDWLNEYADPVGSAVMVDSSLTISGAAADAKVTGDKIISLNDSDFITLKSQILEWNENGYIKTNESVGTEVSLTPLPLNGYRYSITECAEGDKFVISVRGRSTPRAWAFLDNDNKLIAVSGSMKTYSDYMITAPAGAAKLVLNDTAENGNYSMASIKYNGGYTEIANLNAHLKNYINKNGGINYIEFEQGSGSVVDGLLTPSISDSGVRSVNLIPTLVNRNDKIHIADGFQIYVIQVNETEAGYTRYANITNGYVADTVNISRTCACIFFVKRAGGGQLFASETNNVAYIEHGKATTLNIELPNDPYKNVVWESINEKMSASHVHCTTQEQFDTLKTKYDHVAISNYHPSIPYYPLSNYFTGSDTVLASPNAEHFHFSDQDSAVHINSIGATLMSKDGGYEGTIYDAIEAAYKSMILPNGGGVTLNHPHWSGLNAEQIKTIIDFGGVIAMEIWNATCENLNGTGSSLDLWDSVLANGVQLFGTCVPDHESQYRPLENRQPFGYNHMLTVNGTEEEILNCYRTGKFYSSLYNDGLKFTDITFNNNTLSISVNENSKITFKTANNTFVAENVMTANFETNANDVYVRATVERGNNKLFTNAIIL